VIAVINTFILVVGYFVSSRRNEKLFFAFLEKTKNRFAPFSGNHQKIVYTPQGKRVPSFPISALSLLKDK